MTSMFSCVSTPAAVSRNTLGLSLAAIIAMSGCTTNYFTNSAQGTYGVPATERTIPQRLLDRSIEHTAKINVYALQEDLRENSRMSIDSFNSEVLLTGEVPTASIKTQIENVIRSMPDVQAVYNELDVGVARGYSSTLQDGYITSKLVAKIAANDSVKTSQIKVVTNNGLLYLMGRLTPTQQSHLIDIANDTAGVTEVVLLTTLLDDRGVKISQDDIMRDDNLATQEDGLKMAQPVVRQSSALPNRSIDSRSQGIATPEVEQMPVNPAPANQPSIGQTPASTSGSSSPYIDLYKDQ